MIPWFQLTEISLGPLIIQVWGLLVSLAFVAGILITFQEVKRKGLPKNLVLDLAIWIILGAIIGSRLFYVLNEWNQFQNNWLDIFKIWEGGMAFYGGIILSSLAAYIFLRKKGQAFWPWTDAVLVAIPLSLFIGRIGCFLIHDHLGKITTVPWGIEYLGQVRHETALYSMLANLGLFVIILILRKQRFAWPGFITAFFMIYYGLTRFIIDLFRAQDLALSDPRISGFTPSQYFSVIMFGLGLYLFIRLKGRVTSNK